MLLCVDVIKLATNTVYGTYFDFSSSVRLEGDGLEWTLFHSIQNFRIPEVRRITLEGSKVLVDIISRR